MPRPHLELLEKITFALLSLFWITLGCGILYYYQEPMPIIFAWLLFSALLFPLLEHYHKTLAPFLTFKNAASYLDSHFGSAYLLVALANAAVGAIFMGALALLNIPPYLFLGFGIFALITLHLFLPIAIISLFSLLHEPDAAAAVEKLEKELRWKR